MKESLHEAQRLRMMCDSAEGFGFSLDTAPSLSQFSNMDIWIYIYIYIYMYMYVIKALHSRPYYGLLLYGGSTQGLGFAGLELKAYESRGGGDLGFRVEGFRD